MGIVEPPRVAYPALHKLPFAHLRGAAARPRDGFPTSGTKQCAISREPAWLHKDVRGKRQQIISMMLRLGRLYPGKKTWGPAHMNWLRAQKLEHRLVRFRSDPAAACAEEVIDWDAIALH
jgi:hypothetical protein